MRPLTLLSLLLLSFLFYNATTAIRLEREFMQVAHQNIQEAKSSRLIKESNNDGGFKEAIECKEEGHCKGINRKLTTTMISSTSSSTTISTTSSKSDENEGNKSNANGRGDQHEKLKINSNSEHEEVIKNHDEYVDIMDYSPAKRKPQYIIKTIVLN